MTILNPVKGVFRDIPNTGAFEIESNKPLAFGMDLEEYGNGFLGPAGREHPAPR